MVPFKNVCIYSHYFREKKTLDFILNCGSRIVKLAVSISACAHLALFTYCKKYIANQIRRRKGYLEWKRIFGQPVMQTSCELGAGGGCFYIKYVFLAVLSSLI